MQRDRHIGLPVRTISPGDNTSIASQSNAELFSGGDSDQIAGVCGNRNLAGKVVAPARQRAVAVPSVFAMITDKEEMVALRVTLVIVRVELVSPKSENPL